MISLVVQLLSSAAWCRSWRWEVGQPYGGYKRRRLMAEGLASSVIPRDPPRHAHLMCRAQNGAPVPKLSPHVQNYNFSGLAKLSPRGLDFGTQRYLPLAAPTEKRLCRQPPNRSPIARSRSISCAFESYPTWYCPEASSPPPSSSSSSTFYSLGFYSALLLAIPRMHVRTALVHARFFAYIGE